MSALVECQKPKAKSKKPIPARKLATAGATAKIRQGNGGARRFARCLRHSSHRLPIAGSTLLDEAEFYQWVRRVLALRPTPAASSSASGEGTGSANLSQDDEIGLDLVAAFRVFDRDKNGFITKVRFSIIPYVSIQKAFLLRTEKDELRLAMELIDESMTEAALNELLLMADVDRDGRIDYEGKLLTPQYVKILLMCCKTLLQSLPRC